MLHSFSQVIDQFGGPAAYAREVGMTAGAAKQAKRRDSLAAEWFAATARAAHERGLRDITEKTLAEIAERRRLDAA
jgi:hypothetical protein